MTTRKTKEGDVNTPDPGTASWEVRLPHGQSFDPVKAAMVLALLEDGTPPFIGIAADRAGVNRNRVYWWIKSGEGENPRDERTTIFAQSVRRIRGEFMAQATNRLQKATNADKVWAVQLNWLLQRIDRDLFDPPKQVVEKVTTAKDEAAKAPLPATPEAADKAQDELGKPETLQ